MSTNISFDEGYKEYTINDDPDRVIRVDTADYGILTRAKEAEKNIREYLKKYDEIEINADGSAALDDDAAIDAVADLAAYVNKQIDFIFNAEVSKIAFGNASPLATRKGVPLYERFVNAILPIIQKDLEAENKAAQKRVDAYTKQAARFANKVSRK